MLDLTVIIPTYNRRELLRDAVESLRRQTYPADRYEIVIVSDGCTDGTDDLYQTPKDSPSTHLVRQEKRGFGLSAARNLGLGSAQGRLVLFLDDDMVADEQMVEMHVEAHARFGEKVAVCGRVKLAPDLPDTPFCQIVLGDTCRLFDKNPEEPRFLSFQVAFSWQTSFKRDELEYLGGYDETFRSYGWEDIEFSYRAEQRGLRFYYEPRAVSFHRDQRHTLATHADRVKKAARMAPVLFDRHSDLASLVPIYADKGPISLRTDGLGLIAKKVARRLLTTQLSVSFLEWLTPIVERRMIRWPSLLRRWYYGVLSNYMVIGYREGLAAMAARGSGARSATLTPRR